MHRSFDEDWDISSPRNFQPQSFAPSLVGIVLIEPPAQLPSVVANDIVLAWIVARLPPKDLDADFLFCDPRGVSGKRALPNEAQERSEEWGFGEVAALKDAIDCRLTEYGINHPSAAKERIVSGHRFQDRLLHLLIGYACFSLAILKSRQQISRGIPLRI
jgi:hypothetical protein